MQQATNEKTTEQIRDRQKLQSWEKFVLIAQGAHSSLGDKEVQELNKELRLKIDKELTRNENKVSLIAMQLGLLEDFNQNEDETDNSVHLSQQAVYCNKTGQVVGLMYCDKSTQFLTSIAPQWIDTSEGSLEKLVNEEPIGFLVYMLSKFAETNTTLDKVKVLANNRARIYAALMSEEISTPARLGVVTTLQLALNVANRVTLRKANIMLRELFSNPELPTDTKECLKLLNMWAGEVFMSLTGAYATQVSQGTDIKNTKTANYRVALTACETTISQALRGIEVKTDNVLRNKEVNLMQRSVAETTVAHQLRRAKLEETKDLADMFTDLMAKG